MYSMVLLRARNMMHELFLIFSSPIYVASYSSIHNWGKLKLPPETNAELGSTDTIVEHTFLGYAYDTLLKQSGNYIGLSLSPPTYELLYGRTYSSVKARIKPTTQPLSRLIVPLADVN